MPKYVGMGDEDGLDEADEFAPAETTRLVKSQGRQRDNARQEYILRFLEASGTSGATAKECVAEGQRVFDKEEYHGPVSGALSTMRKAGLVVMLNKRRSRYHVYVLPKYVGDSPVKELEDKMLGFGTKTRAADEEVARLKGENDRLRAENERLDSERASALTARQERDVQIDNLLADVEHLVSERDRAHHAAETLKRDFDLRGALVEQREQEIAALRERAQDAEEALAAAPSPTPRKVLTNDEQRLLAGVAKALEKYPTDGTPDAPVRMTIKVGTLRSLGRALQRVTSD